MSIEPKEASTPPNKAGVWLEGDSLVVPTDFVFPPVCLHTGAGDNLRKVERVFDDYDLDGDALSFQTTKRKATVRFYLHARVRRKEWLMKGVLVLFLFAAVGAAGAVLLTGVNPGFALLVLLAGCGAFAWLFKKCAMPIYATKVRASYIWLGGIPKEVREVIYELGTK
ncbi:MAG: hypothetical protein V4773_18080 [Verrucomicrobiota bacterium]